MKPLQHLSHSSVALFADCARAWRAKYVDGLATPTTPPLAIGSAFDATLEGYFRAKVAKVAAFDLEAAWELNWRMVAAQPSIEWGGELPEAVENIGRRLILAPSTQAVLASLRPHVDQAEQPALQTKVELRIPGVPIPLIGYVDITTDDGVPGDFKTAARSWPIDKAPKELQPRFYLAALLQAGRSLPRGPGDGYLFRHWVFTKTKTPQVQVLETEYSPAALFVALEAAAEAWRGITAGVFMPNPRAWMCGPGTCPVWLDCMGKV